MLLHGRSHHLAAWSYIEITIEANKSFGNGSIDQASSRGYFLAGRHWFIFPHPRFPALGFAEDEAHESLDFFGFQFEQCSGSMVNFKPEIQKQIDHLKSLDPFGSTQVMGKKPSFTSRFDQRNNTMCDFALALLGRSRISKRGEYLMQTWMNNCSWFSTWETISRTFWYFFDLSLGIEISLKLRSTLWHATLFYHFTPPASLAQVFRKMPPMRPGNHEKPRTLLEICAFIAS